MLFIVLRCLPGLALLVLTSWGYELRAPIMVNSNSSSMIDSRGKSRSKDQKSARLFNKQLIYCLLVPWCDHSLVRPSNAYREHTSASITLDIIIIVVYSLNHSTQALVNRRVGVQQAKSMSRWLPIPKDFDQLDAIDCAAYWYLIKINWQSSMWLIPVAFPAEHCTGASTHTVREDAW